MLLWIYVDYILNLVDNNIWGIWATLTKLNENRSFWVNWTKNAAKINTDYY